MVKYRYIDYLEEREYYGFKTIRNVHNCCGMG